VPWRGESTNAGRLHGWSNAIPGLQGRNPLLATHPGEATTAYREALRVAPADWPDREVAQAALVEALQSSGQAQQCAESAANFASHMTRDSNFSRTVVAGLWCVVKSPKAEWAMNASEKLEPLADEALSLPNTVRDHRDELYRTRMLIAMAHNHTSTAARLRDQWLAETERDKTHKQR
jgi:hypothetical protein